MDDAQLAQVKAAWMDLPDAAPYDIKNRISVRDYIALQKVAAAQKTSVDAMLAADLANDVKNHLASAPAKP